MVKGSTAEGATGSITEAQGAGLSGMLKGSTAEGATRSITEAQGAGLSGVGKGSAAGGATRSITEARGAGLSGVVKGSTAEGATRCTTEARGAGLDGAKKGSAAGGTTRSITEARGAGLSGAVKGSTAEGATRSNTEARGAGLGGEKKGRAAEGASNNYRHGQDNCQPHQEDNSTKEGIGDQMTRDQMTCVKSRARTTPRSTSQDNFQPHQEDNTTSQDNFQPHLEDDTTKDGIGDQMTGVTSRARTTPRSTSQDNSQQILNPGHTDTMPCEYTSIETLEKRTVIGFRLCHTFRSHEAAREPGNPARNSSGTTVLYRDKATHSYVQTNFESIKGYGKKMTEVKERHAVALVQMIQTTTVTGEAGTDTLRLVRQLLYTGSCDLFQDDATAASIATLELQEQQDILKVRGDPGKVSGVSKPSQLPNPGHTDTMPSGHLSIETLEKGTVFGYRLYHTCLSHEAATERWNPAQRIQTTTVTSEEDNEEDPGHVFDSHTRMVDNLDEMNSETSDLSLSGFHNRSGIGFPPSCGHFSNSTNDPGKDGRPDDLIGGQRTGVTSRARTTPRSTGQDDFQPHQEDNTTKDGIGDQMTIKNHQSEEGTKEGRPEDHIGGQRTGTR